MRGGSIGLAFCTVLGCSGAGQPQASTPPPTASAPSKPPNAPAEPAAPASLEKAFTGQAQPSLTIKNGLSISQHVFVDWAERAVLAAGAAQTLELSVGTHTVTCANSADPDDHPAAITEAIEAGYAYAYELRPGR